MSETRPEESSPIRWDEPQTLHLSCARGIPPILAREVESLGFPVTQHRLTGVETRGTLSDCQMLNLQLRSAQRVLFQLAEARVRTADELYQLASRIPWERYIPSDGYLTTTSAVTTETIRDPRFASLKLKDAIVDRIRHRTGRRPDSGSERSGTVVFLFWNHDECRLYLDTSGESLSRRGYRKIPMAAPMQEALAAAVVLATRWQAGSHFVNPMCGSGTLAIEAALIATGTAPGLFRDRFGFMSIRGYNPRAWQTLTAEARHRITRKAAGRILASDIAPNAVEASRRNAAAAGVQDLIEFQTCDFMETPVPPGPGIVILNPEYGERMGNLTALEATYKRIGDFFKQRCQGYTGYLFTGNLDLAKKQGLRTKRKIQFFNGDIECRLLEYELYEGTRRQSKLALQTKSQASGGIQ